MTGKGAHLLQEDTMIVFAKRLMELYVRGYSHGQLPLFWMF